MERNMESCEMEIGFLQGLLGQLLGEFCGIVQ